MAAQCSNSTCRAPVTEGARFCARCGSVAPRGASPDGPQRASLWSRIQLAGCYILVLGLALAIVTGAIYLLVAAIAFVGGAFGE